MSHRIAKIDILHLPASLLELVAYYPVKVLLIDGIVRTKCCSVIIVNHSLVLVVSIVIAELLNECRDFTLKLYIKGFDNVETTAFTATTRGSVVCDDNAKLALFATTGKFVQTNAEANLFALC